MRLGLNFGYVTTAAQLHENIDLAVAADRLGYDCVWVAEAYGSDAVTVLSAMASRTEKIGIGSGVLQIPGRTPAMTAMTAATLDALSGGRFRLGLGVSGPQVSEGWHGVAFADPVGRTREYVDIVRLALTRKRLAVDGKHFTLPLPDGPGKPLQLSLKPVRKEIPVYLAAIGPKNLDLTGELADGWLGIFVDPRSAAGSIGRIKDAAIAAGRDARAIDITAQVPVSIADDVEEAAIRVRANAALYIGGMGSKTTNFYHRNAVEMGFGSQADVVQERFMARDYQGAAAAVPLEFLDATCLLGTPARIADRLGAYSEGGITSVNVSVFADHPADRQAALESVFVAADSAGVIG